MYADLTGNCKKQRIKNLCDNNVSLANSFRTLRAYTAEITRQIGVGLGAAIRHAVVGLNMLMKYVLKAAQAFSAFMQKIFGKYEGGASFVDMDMSGMSDDMGDFADGADSAADGLDDASDAAEKLKKDLSVLPFDELNQLNKDKEKTTTASGKGADVGGDIGGLGDTDKYGDGMFANSIKESERELTDFEKFLKKWHDKCAESLDAKDWEGLGANIAWGINTGIKTLYDALDPEKVSEKINPWIDAFSTTFNSLVDHINWELLGGTIGRWITNAVNALNRLLDPKTGIDFKNLGRKLGDGFNGMVRNINWRGVGNLISNKFMVGWRIFAGFVEKLDAKDVGNALRDAIGGVVEKLDAETIGSSLGTFVTKCATIIKTGFGKKETWIELGTKIGNGINAFLRGFDGKEVAKAANSIIDALKTAIGTAFSTTDKTELIKDIKDFITNLDWIGIAEFVAPLILIKMIPTFAASIIGHIGLKMAISGAVSKVLASSVTTAGASTAVTTAGSTAASSIGTAVTTGIGAISVPVLAAAGILGVALIGKIWGDTEEGKAEMDRCRTAFTTDVETGLHGVEGAFDGTGYSIEQKQKDTADAIIRENTRWKDQLLWQVIPAYVKANGEAAGSAFELQRAVTLNDDEMIAKLEEWARQNTNYTGQIVQSNQGVETSVRTTTNHWKDCYDGVINHLRQIAEDHDGQVTLMQNKVGEFVSAVETGLSTTGQSWKTLSVDEEGHKQTLLESLDEQIEKVHTWEENLGILAKAGIDEGFLTELARMGTDGAPLVESAVAQINSEGGIDTLNAKWEELINAQGLMDNVGKTLKDAGITNIETAFGEVTTKVEGEGKNIVEGGAKGIKDNASIFTDANKQMGKDGWAAFRTYIRSGSPSKLYEDEGKNIIDGLKVGVQRNETQVTGAMSKMAKNMESAFKNNISIAGMINDVFKDLQNICTTVYNYGVDIGQSFADGIKAVYIPAPYIYVSSYDWIDLGDGAGFSVPNFNVDWYAKGGLFTDFAVFGEAGDEAALPLENQKVMKRIASAITETGNLGLDQETLSSAVARGYVQAMMANQGNERPIDVYATLYTENNEVLARAVQRGQQSIDYRNNPTASYGY